MGMVLPFDVQAKAAGLPAPDPEHQFAPPRLWRFDWAWPAFKVALEVEGGTHVQGRHNRHAGYEGDCRKYNAAAVQGWLVVRATTDMVASGEALTLVEEALRARGCP